MHRARAIPHVILEVRRNNNWFLSRDPSASQTWAIEFLSDSSNLGARNPPPETVAVEPRRPLQVQPCDSSGQAEAP